MVQSHGIGHNEKSQNPKEISVSGMSVGIRLFHSWNSLVPAVKVMV